MGEPTKKFLDLIAAGKIRHGGHPVLRWMASNFAVESDSNDNLKPDKEGSAEKIDGIVAAIIAFALIVRMVAPTRKRSPYATRGAVVVTPDGVRDLLQPPEEPR
jgi:phage terminase large subunit-like protein